MPVERTEVDLTLPTLMSPDERKLKDPVPDPQLMFPKLPVPVTVRSPVMELEKVPVGPVFPVGPATTDGSPGIPWFPAAPVLPVGPEAP